VEQGVESAQQAERSIATADLVVLEKISIQGQDLYIVRRGAGA